MSRVRAITRAALTQRGVIRHGAAPEAPANGAHVRRLHGSRSALAARILSVEELFSRSSLQGHLRRMEAEYERSLQRVGSAQPEGEDLRSARARLSALTPLVLRARELRVKLKESEETEALLQDGDPDMRDLAEMERDACQGRIQDLKRAILSLLIPAEESDMSDLVLEVTAGVGGQEAMLFTAEVFDMYQNFATFQGWGFDVLEYMPSEIGGLRHASASICGPLSFKKMKFEAGVHRVQRVPKTEKQGRMHTSTMTVAVLPQPTEISFTINPRDLRIETKRASGAGGQHVNTTDSAVRIVHLPTGVVSECQQERSQLKNKETAMKVLRARLYSMRLEEETSKRYQTRKLQVGPLLAALILIMKIVMFCSSCFYLTVVLDWHQGEVGKDQDLQLFTGPCHRPPHWEDAP
uniref:Prokaryotic-type class I peptide chain release factors domain-containing protein n=1 Tax=Denticeps clupeoides TaxID=299321 RepID=A0AAY4C8J4_9TELE